jgi:NADH:ubiquinone oxidoreductase subunit 3 (subunit A)
MGIALIVIAVVVVAIAVVAFLAWFLGWDVGRATDPLKASANEAGERSADGIAEFWDWLRLGR